MKNESMCRCVECERPVHVDKEDPALGADISEMVRTDADYDACDNGRR